MRIRRSLRLSTRARRAAEQRYANARRKHKEQARRDRRMMAVIHRGSLPYTPDVMSWLSRKLHKRSSRITAADVAAVSQ